MNDFEKAPLVTMQRHYGDPRLIAALQNEFADEPSDRRLGAADLAMLDQLHTRGYAATVDLARMIDIGPYTRVLDVGAGLGGPARYLAETYGCSVTGIDASADLVRAAEYLSTRWSGPVGLVTFSLGDALALTYPDGAFDLVWMQHVAMNIRDRRKLYRGVRRVLRQGGLFATYDVVRKRGDLIYPTPWASDSGMSTVLDAEQTRTLVEAAGFAVKSWKIDTAAALEWVARTTAPSIDARPPRGSTVMRAALGENFRQILANLGKNYVEGRADVLAAIMEAV